ncbi:MAG: ABC transporter ATP-binding protein, partial [Pseudomonadota bacterium]
CLALAGLLPRRAGVTGGAVVLDGVDLRALDPAGRRRLRRERLAFVFQDATNGLNPVRTIGWQVAEAVRLRERVSARAARARAIELLQRVGMPEPARQARAYPFQLSGGMNQRAMIALAVAGQPRLLIADEATTALDVTIQAQILSLIADLRRDFGMALLFVTHDLGLVAEIADHVAVMYAGRVVERAPVGALFAAPQHPYTAALLGSLPRVDARREALAVIEGQVPPIDAMPAGCAFAPRCASARDRCRLQDPVIGAGEAATACHFPLGRAAA